MIYVLTASSNHDWEASSTNLILASYDKEKLQSKMDEVLRREHLIQEACHKLVEYCKVIHELPPPRFSMPKAEWEKKSRELDEQFYANMNEKQSQLAFAVGVDPKVISAWRVPTIYKIEEVATV